MIFVNHVKNRSKRFQWINSYLICRWFFFFIPNGWARERKKINAKLNDRFSCHYVIANDFFFIFSCAIHNGSFKVFVPIISIEFCVFFSSSFSSLLFHCCACSQLDFSGLFNIGIFLHNFSFGNNKNWRLQLSTHIHTQKEKNPLQWAVNDLLP